MKKGDKVMLPIGMVGPVMIVLFNPTLDRACCGWWDGLNRWRTEWFDERMLEPWPDR